MSCYQLYFERFWVCQYSYSKVKYCDRTSSWIWNISGRNSALRVGYDILLRMCCFTNWWPVFDLFQKGFDKCFSQSTWLFSIINRRRFFEFFNDSIQLSRLGISFNRWIFKSFYSQSVDGLSSPKLLIKRGWVLVPFIKIRD